MWAYKKIKIIKSTITSGIEDYVLWEFFYLTPTISIEQMEERTGFTFIK